MSVLHGIGKRAPFARLTSFDYCSHIRTGEVEGVRYQQLGACRTRRVYAPHSYAAIEAALRFRLPISPSAKRIRSADAILDISGGDSFTDLYGPGRLKSIAWPKLTALRLKKPLILLPQTYGPFNAPENRALAQRICRGAAAAWARDERSFAVLRDLLGDEFDPDRHRCGVDVAFLLPTRAPSVPLGDRLGDWLEGRDDASPLVGVNVSGLLYNDPEAAKTRYGFKADYRELCRGLVERLTAEGARVVLTPHVVTPPGHYESDVEASERLVESLSADAANRIAVAPAFADPREVKWLIGQFDWFCGTRMHSTIAGLSQGVPTAAVAYSIKTQGVFETCGQGDHVADPRQTETEEVVERLVQSYRGRAGSRASLGEHLPKVKAKAEEQMDAIAANVRDAAEARSHQGTGR